MQLKHRSRDILGHRAFQHKAHHFRLMAAFGYEDYPSRMHYRPYAESETSELMLRPDSCLAADALLEHRIHRRDPCFGAERRPRLIYANMTVVAQSEHLKVYAALLLKLFLEHPAFFRKIVGDSLRHDEPLVRYVQSVGELIADHGIAASGVRSRQISQLVHVEKRYPACVERIFPVDVGYYRVHVFCRLTRAETDHGIGFLEHLADYAPGGCDVEFMLVRGYCDLHFSVFLSSIRSYTEAL